MDLTKRQQELKEILFSNKFNIEQINAMKMTELISLHKTAAQLLPMMMRKEPENFKVMEKRAKVLYGQVLERLKTMPEIFVAFSTTDNLPYVFCDEKTFDDQVYIFSQKDYADRMVEIHEEKKIPLIVRKVENKDFLGFYLSLYRLGVNAMVIDQTNVSLRIQLKELVQEPDYSKVEEAKRPAYNPELQLTAIYFVQELRRQIQAEEKKDVKALEEELYAHLHKGRYFILVKQSEEVMENGQKRLEIPLVKSDDGSMFQPIFTDLNEMSVFPDVKDFRAIIVDYDHLKNTIPENAKGIVLNPFGVRVIIPKPLMK